MHKSRAIVEPIIKESNTIIINTESGKELEICIELDSYAWVENNLSTLRKFYKGKVVELLQGLLIVFPIGLLIYLEYIIVAVGIALLAMIGMSLYVKDVLEARRDMIEFKNQMESGQLEPNIDKSIRCYYTNHSNVADAWYLLALNQKKVIDYEICSDELNTNFFKVVSANKETGDIETREFRRLMAIQNMKIKHPTIRILPHGMELRIPYKTIT